MTSSFSILTENLLNSSTNCQASYMPTFECELGTGILVKIEVQLLLPSSVTLSLHTHWMIIKFCEMHIECIHILLFFYQRPLMVEFPSRTSRSRAVRICYYCLLHKVDLSYRQALHSRRRESAYHLTCRYNPSLLCSSNPWANNSSNRAYVKFGDQAGCHIGIFVHKLLNLCTYRNTYALIYLANFWNKTKS